MNEAMSFGAKAEAIVVKLPSDSVPWTAMPVACVARSMSRAWVTRLRASAKKCPGLRRHGNALGVVADEQLQAKLVLKLGDGGGKRRLRHPQPLCGLRNGTNLLRGNGIFKLAERISHHR